MTKASSTTSIASPHPSPNWRGTPSVVTVVTTPCGAVPVWVVNGTWSRGKTLLIIVVVIFVAGRLHHPRAVVVEMRGHRGGRGAGGTGGRVE